MVDKNYIKIKQRDGYVTKLRTFFCEKKPKASILILHGMAEHQDRYNDFIQYLTKQDFDVYIYNHRGHGKDAIIKELGFISRTNGYQLLINDVVTVTEYIEKNNRSNKLFLFCHSMGSLIARNVIQSYDKYTGVILSGTTMPSEFYIYFGCFLSSVIKFIKGPKHITPYFNNFIYGNKKFTRLSKRTAFDWLTRNNTIVGAYINDPYCGFVCSASFYHDLTRLNINASKKKLVCQTKRELPFYIISGEMDPVGNYGKEIKKYTSFLKKCGFTNVTSKLYPDCRHEILNEINNQEIYSDIVHWISKKI